mgnify:CR=1 FL=1
MVAADEAAARIAEQNDQQYTAEDSARVQREALQSVADTLAPGSPLRVQLEGYIAALLATEGHFTATIETVYTSSGTAHGTTPVGRRAKGGPVSAGEPYIVGEDGPELMVPGQSGTVVPSGSGGRAAAGALNVTVQVFTRDPDTQVVVLPGAADRARMALERAV